MIMKACIFDLDGVIVDTAKYHFLAWKKLADQLGVNFTYADNERLKGVSRMESLETILKSGNITLGEQEKEELAAKKNNWFVEYLDNMSANETLPGVVSFLDDLDNNHIRKAIGSASKNAVLALRKIGLEDRFDLIIDGTMVSRAKPDPEVFLKAATGLGLPPGQCLVFEDAHAGIQAAHNGKMKCVGVGNPDILGEADVVIDSFSNINWKTILKLLNTR
ncbi:MAG: beta-phosphoglucomutase [Bacteroidetes bacterium]|nr:beta-phosphoglucomutase [Bacteroidota bacterium]